MSDLSNDSDRLRRQLFDTLDVYSKAVQVLRDLLQLHRPYRLPGREICDGCHGDWPCRTFELIEAFTK